MPVVKFFDKLFSAGKGNIPFFDIPDAFGVFKKRRGDMGYVAKACAANC